MEDISPRCKKLFENFDVTTQMKIKEEIEKRVEEKIIQENKLIELRRQRWQFPKNRIW